MTERQKTRIQNAVGWVLWLVIGCAIGLGLVLPKAHGQTPTVIWEAYAFVASPANPAFPTPKPGFQPLVLGWL